MMGCMRHPRFVFLTAVAALLVTSCSSGDGSDRASGPSPSVLETESDGGGTGNSNGKTKPAKKTDTTQLADDPAPEFEVETFDGGTFAIREQLGTPVVLNFWESW